MFSSAATPREQLPAPRAHRLTKICLTPIPPYQRSRIASAPSVFSRRPMYKSSLSLSVAQNVSGHGGVQVRREPNPPK